MKKTLKNKWVKAAFSLSIAAMFITGCANPEKTPATAEVAVSKAAVTDAAAAGGMQYSPLEMTAAREKMVQANKAMTDKDYKLARELASQAEADASLAQSKASSAKAKLAADALKEDVRILREELDRASK